MIYTIVDDGAESGIGGARGGAELPGRGEAEDLELALELADEADAILLEHFRGGRLQARSKDDGTPVTEVDGLVERRVRELLAARRPEDSVLGEEGGLEDAGTRRWVIDPLDGTKNYIRGVPVFAFLLALEDGGRETVGVASAPALGLRWWALRGGGAFRLGERISVSAVSDLARAELMHSGLGAWRRHGRMDAFLALERASGRTRGYGDFWPMLLVAEGSADLAVEPGGLHLWDFAAPRMILEEAGGLLTGLDGDASCPDGSVLASNGLLHEAALAVLGSAAAPA